MKKVCTICKELKSLDAFSWYKKSKGQKLSKCKSCTKEYSKKWRSKIPVEVKKATAKKEYSANKHKWKERYESTKDGNTHVYILPKANYAGITYSTVNRKAMHKHVGRYVDDMRVIYSTPDRDEALELEELLHDIGYEGRHAYSQHRYFKN